jgi:hypothetical protein
MSFAQGHYTQCKGYIDDFLDTIKEETESAKTIKTEFDKIYQNQKKLEDAIEQQAKNLGYLERKDFEDTAKTELGANTIHDLKEICWRISLKYKLFEDDEATK